MKIKAILSQTFLSKKPLNDGALTTLIFTFLLILSTVIFNTNQINAYHWMPASFESVYHQKEYWRLWTALFAHEGVEHLGWNLLFFVPFSFYLISYFGYFFFPIFGFLMGGIINALVVLTLPPDTTLIGISGLVYWMWSSWVILFVFIERRQTLKKRIFIALGVSLILFFPETYKPSTSYLSHFLGYLFGMLSGALFYFFKRQKFLASESWDLKLEENFDSFMEGEEVTPP
ncbi:MAG: rhomboid family intramembrane serine protease [Bacteriovoracaceae bacterium]